MRWSAQALAQRLLGQRHGDAGLEVAGGGAREAGDLRRETAVLGDHRLEAGEVAGLAGLEQAGELAEPGRGHSGLRSRAALRMRSAKRTAAATAR